LLDEDQDFTRRDDQIIIDTEGGRTPLSEMSVGYKSVVAMATDIIRELMYHYDNLELAHAVVLIDEIETHLHPRWKMRIMGLLRRAFPKVQFIVTTHDPLCLRGMFDGEVFVLQRSPEDQRVETLVDLPRIQGMRAEQILTSEFFGLGSTDPETEAQLAVYNSLAARIETLKDHEKEQLENLRCKLDQNMVLGNTMAEQAYSEALKKEVAETQVTPTKVRNPKRKRMVINFAEALRKGRGK
ncbi:MAG: AAA family ATPase, partial [Gammaproteobacteria bacterium]|nr:AAA family ATPase [Gammaproteobacteria bacterium]